MRFAQERQTLVKAPALKVGDRVSLVAPSGRPASPSQLRQCVELVESLGLVASLGKNILKFRGSMAGSDDERLDDLLSAIYDQESRAIFVVAGGYGSLRLIDRLDYIHLAENPKLILGGEEATSLLTAIHVSSGLCTFIGPNLNDIESKETLEHLKTVLFSIAAPPPMLSPSKKDIFQRGFYSAVTGTAEGTTLGGNLSALISLFGTEFKPDFKDSILVLEDRNEQFGILDRWFTTLYLSADLQKSAGVCFGTFHNCGLKGSFNMLSVEETFAERLKELKKPSFFGLPFGQNSLSSVLPLGIKARLDSLEGILEFGEGALS